MAIEIFNRQELKFVISRSQFEAIMPTILQYEKPDQYNKNGQTYRLYNLYIDTADFALIRHSMAKPTVYKEKIRVRSYEPLDADSIVFLEVKKRYKKITNKRRTKITLREALDFIETGRVPKLQPYMNQQVVGEMSVILNQYNYQPATYISYDRLAFVPQDEVSDLRITFDTNLVSRRYNTTEDNRLLDKDKLIMEVKSIHNMPIWLAKLLDEQNIYKQSFSKYGTEYIRILKQSKQGEI